MNNKKSLNSQDFVTFKEILEKSAFLKIAALAIQAEDFRNIFLRFLGFWDSFSYTNCFIKKTRVWLFLATGAINRDIKKIFSDNHFHNNLGLFYALPNFPFTTSETKHGY